MTDTTLESPLVNLQRLGKRELRADGKPCLMDEIPFLDLINLRGNPADPAFVQGVQRATGLGLPLQANTANHGDGRQLLWLGPDEWLLKLPQGQGEAAEDALRQALAGQHFSVVQVGSGYTTLLIEGAGAAALINTGCPLDLHPRSFPSGSLAQSHIAKANVVLLCREAGTRYEVTVRRTFADYLWRWLCEAGS